MAIYKNNQAVKDIYMVGHGLADINAVGLQENVDYIRYQYLIGDGTAYATTTVNIYRDTVNTLIVPTTTVANTIMYQVVSKLGDTTNYAELSTFITATSTFAVRHTVRVNNQPDSHDITVSNYVNNTYTIKTTRSGTNYVYYLNGSQVAASNHGQYVEADTNITPIIYANGCKLGYFSTSGSNNVNLVPCRLLHSIPASLDANNKARQEGEYGMIDLVSKKFYGNVNNSGSFTGEGLIQKKVTFAFFNGKHVFGEMQEGIHIRRYGWLKGDGAAYIDTKITDIRQSNVKVRFRDTDQVTNGSRVFGSETANNGNRLTVTKINNDWSVFDGRAGRKIVDGGIVVTLDFNAVAKTLSVNGSVTNYYPTSSILLDTILLFTQNRRENSSSPVSVGGISKVSISYFEIENQINLVPCQLLRPIPAELDGNGIARAAGTCGMYDEKNHKFYGNVANSGTFTVEGMAEGYDYEVYQYLKGTGGCYIDTLINPAWNDQLSATTEVEGQPTVVNPTILNAYGTNTEVGLCLGESWYNNNIPSVSAVHREVGETDNKEYNGFSASAEIYVSLKLTNNAAPTTSCKINGASWTTGNTSGDNIITALPDTTYKIGSITSGLDVLKLKNVKINSHNFMPCKLLRATPAELDANGIAREANECGMVDTYTGLFYGNVNSEGTFTVDGEGLVESYHYEKYEWIEQKSSAYRYVFMSNTIDSSDGQIIVRLWNYTDGTNNGREYIKFYNSEGTVIALCYSYPDGNFRLTGTKQGISVTNKIDNSLEIVIDPIATAAVSYSFPNPHWGDIYHKWGYVKSNNYNYVPCKLLKGIPANLTFNGVSYPSGTIGMVETISGKFRGFQANATLSTTVTND